MTKKTIHTDDAPAAIGTYSQAIEVNDFVFLSGQIPLDPATMEIVDGDFEARARRVFDNLSAVAAAAGGTPGSSRQSIGPDRGPALRIISPCTVIAR